jgi:hypothetical protein
MKPGNGILKLKKRSRRLKEVEILSRQTRTRQLTKRRRKMQKKPLLLLLALSVFMLALGTNIAISQDKGQTQAPAEGPQTTLEGKIVYLTSFGGYVVITEAPHEEYKIINENEKILGDLVKKDKSVKIEGRLPRGAYLLFIEKINGKKYSGGK